MQDVIYLTIGVLLVAALGEVIRRMRTGNLTQKMTIQPKVPSKAGKI